MRFKIHRLPPIGMLAKLAIMMMTLTVSEAQLTNFCQGATTEFLPYTLSASVTNKDVLVDGLISDGRN